MWIEDEALSQMIASGSANAAGSEQSQLVEHPGSSTGWRKPNLGNCSEWELHPD
jgi:hypothetical protein